MQWLPYVWISAHLQLKSFDKGSSVCERDALPNSCQSVSVTLALTANAMLMKMNTLSAGQSPRAQAMAAGSGSVSGQSPVAGAGTCVGGARARGRHVARSRSRLLRHWSVALAACARRPTRPAPRAPRPKLAPRARAKLLPPPGAHSVHPPLPARPVVSRILPLLWVSGLSCLIW